MSRPDLRAAAALAGDDPAQDRDREAECAAHRRQDPASELRRALGEIARQPDQLEALRILRGAERLIAHVRATVEQRLRAELDGDAPPITEPETTGIVVVDRSKDN